MPCTPLNIFSNISVCPCSAARCLDDEAIDEKGVDSSEEIDFNVVPIMHEEEIGNFDEFDDNFVRDKDYLMKVNQKKAGDTKSTFLAVTEGAAAVR